MPQPTYLGNDSWTRARDLAFTRKVQDDIHALTFPQTIRDGIDQITKLGESFMQPAQQPQRAPLELEPLKMPEPLPIVVSDRPQTPDMQVQQQAAPPVEASMPAPDMAPGGVPGGAPTAMPGSGGPVGDRVQAQQRAYQLARQSGLDDEGARIIAAVVATEGGHGGAVGDNGQAHGWLQFHEGGMLPGFAAWLQQQGIRGDPRQHAQNPELAIRYASEGYLGQAIAEGRRLGYTGARLATYVQQHGQRSVRPETTGANYDALPADLSAPTRQQAAPGPEAPAPQAQQQPSPGAVDIDDLAKRYGGGSYVFGGGRDRNGYGIPGSQNTDCSGFVSAVWKEKGLDLPAHTDAAYADLTGRGAQQVSMQDARPGDVVFYMGSGYGGAVSYHMGIYAGNGRVLDSSRSGQGQGVMLRPITHAGGPGDIVILRDPRVNGRADPRRAAAPPPIQPSGLAESPEGQQIVAQQEQAQAPAQQQQPSTGLPPSVVAKWRQQFGREPTAEEAEQLMGVIGGFA